MNETELIPVSVPSGDGPGTEEYRRAAYSKSTARAYTADLRDFAAWLQTSGRTFAAGERPSSEDVAEYLAFLARHGTKVSTIRRRVATLGRVYNFSLRRDPVIGPVLSGIERTHGVRQQGKDALLLEDVEKVLEVVPDDGNLLHIRDRAIVLLGFAGAFRRSELAALEYSDLQFRDEGLLVRIGKSKTDQTGAGRVVGIPFGSHEGTCPVRAVKRWIEQAVINTGPLFRRVYAGKHVGQELEPQAIWCVIRRVCAKAGLDPQRFGAHSLRAGMVTQAIRGGASDHAIMAQTGHKSSDMVRRYRRETDVFRDNAAGKLGL